MSSSDDRLPRAGATLQQVLRALVATLNEAGIPYAIIGGLAAIQHGRIRATDDIDVLLDIPQLAMPGLFESLRDRGFRVDVQQVITELRDGGLTVLRSGDTLVDLIRPVLPVYTRVLDRAISAEILGQSTRVVSVEGLIVLKLAAMRPQDEADVQELLTAHAGALDVTFIRESLEDLTDPSDPRRTKFDTWLGRKPA